MAGKEDNPFAELEKTLGPGVRITDAAMSYQPLKNGGSIQSISMTAVDEEGIVAQASLTYRDDGHGLSPQHAKPKNQNEPTAPGRRP